MGEVSGSEGTVAETEHLQRRFKTMQHNTEVSRHDGVTQVEAS